MAPISESSPIWIRSMRTSLAVLFSNLIRRSLGKCHKYPRRACSFVCFCHCGLGYVDVDSRRDFMCILWRFSVLCSRLLFSCCLPISSNATFERSCFVVEFHDQQNLNFKSANITLEPIPLRYLWSRKKQTRKLSQCHLHVPQSSQLSALSTRLISTSSHLMNSAAPTVSPEAGCKMLDSSRSHKLFAECPTVTHVKCNSALAIINHKRNFFFLLPRPSSHGC